MENKKIENKHPVKQNGVDVWRGIKIPDNMVKDAFPALALSILQEFWLSGDTKMLMFYGMLDNLKKMGYSEEDIEKFKVGINECFKKFHKENSFMG